MDKPQKLAAIVLAIIIGLGTLAVAVLIISSQLNKTTISIGSGVFNSKVAYDESARVKGLNGTSSLGSNQAMLFVFPSDDRWTMTTADMKYSIDIVWLNQNYEVVYLVKDASSNSKPTEFTPTLRTRYVIELPSGSIEKYGIKISDKAVFSIDEGLIK